jgi:anaerobic selenocysteine-containing dehydrogenase
VALPTTSHWGAYTVRRHEDGSVAVLPHPRDPDPSPLLGNVPGALAHRTRVAAPAVRRGWLEQDPGPSDRRGAEEFVEVGWDEALDLLAAELTRVRDRYGNEAVYGGSYGWASAGRFHHAQSQLHRFLALFGGYTGSRNSLAAGIAALARRMAASRTLITVTWSLQRIQHGEQPVWAGLALAAILGQIGLPGGGFGHGYGSVGDVGDDGPQLRLPRLPPVPNPIPTFIPVDRIADMLLHPGESFLYDGSTYIYPDSRLVHWAGGNPFHHHQDLNRPRRAFARPDTLVVHEPYWTATARQADVVLPVTTTLEREDLGSGRRDSHLIAMHRAVEPARRRRGQPGEQGRRPRTTDHAPSVRRGPRHRRRRSRPGVQRPRRLPGRSGAEQTAPARRRPARHGRLVRPVQAPVRPRQPQRPHRRRAQLAAVPRLHRAARARRDRGVRRRSTPLTVLRPPSIRSL